MFFTFNPKCLRPLQELGRDGYEVRPSIRRLLFHQARWDGPSQTFDLSDSCCHTVGSRVGRVQRSILLLLLAKKLSAGSPFGYFADGSFLAGWIPSSNSGLNVTTCETLMFAGGSASVPVRLIPETLSGGDKAIVDPSRCWRASDPIASMGA